MSGDKVIPVKVALRIRPLVPKEKADLANECLIQVDGSPQVRQVESNLLNSYILLI